MTLPWWWWLCVCGHVLSCKCVRVGQSTCLCLCVCVCVCVRVMCIVLSSLGCIHCPSHRSMYRWGCNYVPQWSSLCFFTAQELSRQRSVCAPWKLPAENHMAMRAIMDFFSPSQDPSPSLCLSLVLFFPSVFLLLSMNIWADVNWYVLRATSAFVLQQPPKLSRLYSLVILEMHTDMDRQTHRERIINMWDNMIVETKVRRCFINSKDDVMNSTDSSKQYVMHPLTYFFIFTGTDLYNMRKYGLCNQFCLRR